MITGICLSYEELIEVTGLKKYSAQLRWLRREGFIAKTRADGMPLVARGHFESMMGSLLPGKTQSNQHPDFSSLI